MNALKATHTGLMRALLSLKADQNISPAFIAALPETPEPERRDFAAFSTWDGAVAALKDYLASGEIKPEDDADIVRRGLWWITTEARRP